MYYDFFGWDPILVANQYLKCMDKYLNNINKYAREHPKEETDLYLIHYKEETYKVLSKKKK